MVAIRKMKECMAVPKFQVKRGDIICLLDLQHSRCEMSNFLFARLGRFLDVNHHSLSPDLDKADVLVVNTCAVRDTIMHTIEAKITALISHDPARKVIIIGCLAPLTERFSQTSGLALINPDDIDRFTDYFECDVPLRNIDLVHKIGSREYQPKMTGADTYVLTSQGCINNCSYCNIKLAKGYVKSRPSLEIVKEVTDLVRSEKYEITLLSDDCGSYGYDSGTNITELISNLLNIDQRLKIKIYTIYPGLFIKRYPQFKEHIKANRITYFCIPIQSGSHRILKLMNRNYNLNQIKSIIQEIKELNPDLHLFTHFIFNFPTETVEDLKKSIVMAQSFDSCIFIGYDDNKRTLASKIGPKCSDDLYRVKVQLIQTELEKINGLQYKIL